MNATKVKTGVMRIASPLLVGVLGTDFNLGG
jgi:hypothetical protein